METDPKTLVQRLNEYGAHNVLPDSYNLLKEAAQRIQDHEECDADRRRLVRELDVLLNGPGAAKQASLCDIVGQVRREMSGLEETDMAKSLRRIATDPKADAISYLKARMVDAAYEIDRYYKGMINWKRTAEEKDESSAAAPDALRPGVGEVWHVRYKGGIILATIKVIEITDKTVVLDDVDWLKSQPQRRTWDQVTFVERVEATAATPAQESGWCLERSAAPGPQYLFVDHGCFDWTFDYMKAVRLSRRADAEQLAMIVEDADRIAEHVWIADLPKGEING